MDAEADIIKEALDRFDIPSKNQRQQSLPEKKIRKGAQKKRKRTNYEGDHGLKRKKEKIK